MTSTLSFDHVAISVPSLDGAIAFYTEVCGFHVFASIDAEQIKSYGFDAAVEKAFGTACRTFKTAYLSTGNGVVIELLEFQDPAYTGPKSPPEGGLQPEHYTQGGFFHIAIVAEDVEALLAKAEEKGAKRIGDTFEPVPGQVCAYMWDPWGNAVEVMSFGLQGFASKALEHHESK